MSQISDDELMRALRSWAGAAREDAAVSERRERHWQHELATDEMRFGGLLLDLVERMGSVEMSTATGRNHSGRLVALGTDFATVAAEGRLAVLLSLDTITSVRLGGPPQWVRAPSSRTPPEHLPRLRDVLSEMAIQRSKIRFVLKGGNEMRSGAVVAVGDDVAAVALAGPPDSTLFVPIEQFAEVSAG